MTTPQEQWMELVRKQVKLIRESAIGVETGRYVDFNEALEQGMVSLVSDILTTQIELAEKRVADKVLRLIKPESYTDPDRCFDTLADIESMLTSKESDKLTDEEIASLTNHN